MQVFRNLNTETKLSTGCIGASRYTPCSVISLFTIAAAASNSVALVIKGDKMQ